MTPDEPLAPRLSARFARRPTLSVWQRFVREWLVIGCIGVATIFACVFGGITTNLDRLVYDRLLTSLPLQPLASEIGIVCIDDPSVSERGRWPWSRALQAQLIDAVVKAGAVAIVYDVLLTEPAQGDGVLARAFRAVPTYLPVYIDPRRAAQAIGPAEPLAAAAAGIGHVDLRPDSDGIVRGVMLRERAAGVTWPYLLVPLLTDVQSGKLAATGAQARAGNLRSVIAAAALSDDWFARNGEFILVPFSARVPSVPSARQFSASQLLDGQVPAGALRGKIVLVGLAVSSLPAQAVAPLSEQWEPALDLPLHAYALSALLRGQAIHPISRRWLFATALVPLVGLLTGLLFFSPWRSLLLTLVLGSCSFVLSVVLLRGASIWITPVPALTALLAVYPLWGWRRLEMTMWRLRRELQRLAHDADMLPSMPAQPRNVRGDVLERHIALVEQAADRVQDMKQFVWDCLNSLPEPILVADPLGTICLVNKASHACFARMNSAPPEGRKLTEALGEMTFIKTMGTEFVFDDELRTRWPDVLDPTDSERVKIVKRGIEVHDRAGHDYLLRYARCRDARGEPSGYWVAGLVDVTTLHAAEQAREDALRLLSHDMRSPHASVLALIESEMGSTRSERVRVLLLHIERYTRRALTLADDFVQLARAESQAYVLEAINLADIVLDASDEIWPQARAKRILVETHFDGDAHWIRADRSLLRRAVTNLLNNAVKYSPSDTAVHISVFNAADDRGHCKVADQGYGMAEDARAHLFERFRRFNAPGQPHTQGAGLGMALVKAVVMRHDGYVKVESQLGQGTIVTVSLPRWHAES